MIDRPVGGFIDVTVKTLDAEEIEIHYDWAIPVHAITEVKKDRATEVTIVCYVVNGENVEYVVDEDYVVILEKIRQTGYVVS